MVKRQVRSNNITLSFTPAVTLNATYTSAPVYIPFEWAKWKKSRNREREREEKKNSPNGTKKSPQGLNAGQRERYELKDILNEEGEHIANQKKKTSESRFKYKVEK